MTGVVQKNWFYFFLPFLLAAAWSVSTSPAAIRNPLMLERVLLFDVLVSLPLLYFLFLRRRASRSAAIVRVAALAGTGVWLASLLMPDGTGQILPWLAGLRYIALPVLVGIELVALVAVIRYVFGASPDEAHLVKQGMPPLIAKAMLAEARFWKRVASWFRAK